MPMHICTHMMPERGCSTLEGS